MPFIGGRRVSLAEWQAAQPVRPLVRYFEDGSRVVVNAAEVEAAARQADAEAWAKAENERRSALILTSHVAVPMVSAVDYPGPAEEVLTSGRQPRNEAAALWAIADALGVGDDDDAMADIDLTPAEYTPSGQVIAVPADHEPVDVPYQPDRATERPETVPGGTEKRPGPTHRAKDAAWRASKGIGRGHRKDRPSQTSAGRHVRHVRQMAAEWQVPLQVADSRIEHRGGSALTCPIKNGTTT